jgi:hypothetical protein
VRRAIALAASALALAAAAGCGGSSSTVTKTITTDQLPTTATVPTTATTLTAPTTSDAGTLGEDRLPPADAVSGLRPGGVRQLADPQLFVDALYQAGDPTKPVAAARLTGEGYAGGILRDQIGKAPTTGIALFRTYAFRLRDDAAAQGEVDASVEEVRNSTTQPTSDIDVSDLSGARALRVDISQGGLTGAVAFVTFAAGPYVYGLQGVSTSGAGLPQDEIVAAARDLYEKVTAAP